MKDQKNYQQLYQDMKRKQEKLHARNRKRIRGGIRCILTIPLFFLLLMFLTRSNKALFLTLWITSLFLLAAYLIYVEYGDFQIQKAIAEISREEAGQMSLLAHEATDSDHNAPENEKKPSKKGTLAKRIPERWNTPRIILHDLRKISSNVVAIVILMGLAILPSLYAWFNILSNWDPYEEDATSRLKIAVVSKDKGYEKNQIRLCIGDTVVESLSANSTMGWRFPKSERKAINGVFDGDYYAALVIPENFTKSLAGVLEGDLSGATISYYENEKKNAIATKITSKAKTTVQNQVNRSVFATVTEIGLKLGSSLKEMQSQGSLEQTLTEKLDQLNAEISDQLTSLQAIRDAGTTGKETLSTVSSMCGKLTQDLQADLSLLPGNALQLTGLQAASVRLSDYADTLKTAGSDIDATRKLLQELQKTLAETKKGIAGISSNAQFQEMLSLLSENPEQLSEYLSSLMEVDTIPIYETANYGSSMAPFYTVLAIWVGALILVAIIHLNIHPAPGMTELKTHQEYFGRYALFFLIGQAQTLLCVLGDLFFLEIQCQHPFLFWLAAAVSSFVFTVIIYSLTFVFGNVGEALAVVIMVIQVAGTGGTFPKEVLPDIYQKVFDFLPFPYCMTALRECVAGRYRQDYWIALGKLLLFALIFLAMALLLKKPFRKINARIEKSKEKSGLMI